MLRHFWRAKCLVLLKKDSAPSSYWINEPGDIHILLQRLIYVSPLHFITEKFICVQVRIINLNFSGFHGNNIIIEIRTIGLWRWYITIIILDIIHCPVFYSKQNCLETESSLRNVIFLIKDRTMDNVQNCDSHIILGADYFIIWLTRHVSGSWNLEINPIQVARRERSIGFIFPVSFTDKMKSKREEVMPVFYLIFFSWSSSCISTHSFFRRNGSKGSTFSKIL
jgi:hypothetical protein